MSGRTRVAYVAEPPAAYLVRPPVVVDCSAMAALVFEESLAENARQLVGGRALHAPWLIDHEMASVAARKKKGRVAAEVIDLAVDLYEAFDILKHRVRPADVLPLVATYALSAYDAAYLALATALRAPLVTFDDRLGKAAMKHLGSLS